MAFWMGCLDLRGQYELPTLQTAPTKKAMAALAKERGWSQENITKAANRFNRFWICGQWIEYGRTFRAMSTTPGETVVLTIRQH